jgi:hypothetical protein
VYGPSPWPDCGTDTARNRHYSRGEKLCPECGPGPRVAVCGTPGGQRRHYRNGERPCQACRLAANRVQGERKGWAGNSLVEDPRPVRNGIPEVAYEWRARRYPWAVRVLARAEAVWGRPDDEEAA